MTETSYQGASNNERLLSAAQTDNQELIEEVFEHPNTFDINFRDGLGNTVRAALHYAAQHGSTTALEYILSYEGCDVDLQNYLEHDTPLHAGLKNLKDDPEIRNQVIESLLEAGSDTTIKDKNGDLPIDLVSSSSRSHDDQLRAAIRKAQADVKVLQADLASDDDADYDGSDSGSDD